MAQRDVTEPLEPSRAVQQILIEQDRYSRAGAGGEVEIAVDLEQVVRNVWDGLDPDLQRAAELVIDASLEAAPDVVGPRVQVQQVVGNLVLNAVESIRDERPLGGRVLVRVEPERATADGKLLAHVSFEDNGAGVEPENLARIFDRHFSTKQRGSGLGLHWSANTVAALGGRLFAVSRGGGLGATLHLLLPIAEGAAEGAGAEVRKDTA